jgi:hypothetical protein
VTSALRLRFTPLTPCLQSGGALGVAEQRKVLGLVRTRRGKKVGERMANATTTDELVSLMVGTATGEEERPPHDRYAAWPGPGHDQLQSPGL